LALITVRIDDRLKDKMKRMRHVNWSEVIRAAIAERISLEESAMKRNSIDLDLLERAMTDQDRLRDRTSGTWSGSEEIQKWRELRK
jgi:hypothetical protein